MKSCPTCNKTYTDEHLSFCIDDGTPLVNVAPPDRTIQTAPRFNDDPGTSDRVQWNESDYQPPSYVPPGGSSKRRVWPWIVGIVGVLILAFAGLAVAIAIILPRMVVNRTSSRQDQPVIVESNENANRNENSNSSSKTSTRNDNKTENVTSDAPTDPDLVLAQLTNLEHEWTVANINADKKQLGRILADDYAGAGSNGQIQGKAEYLKGIQRDTSIQKWEFQNLKVSLRGDRATLTGRLILRRQNQDIAYDFVDKFVWRDGRWQATGSEVTQNQDKLL